MITNMKPVLIDKLIQAGIKPSLQPLLQKLVFDVIKMKKLSHK